MQTLTATQTDLLQTARVIREHQQARGWTLAELMRHHGGSEALGSDKTFNKILASDFSEMNVEKKLEDYRRVLHILEDTAGQAEEGPEPVFGDFVHAAQVRAGLVRAMNTSTVARVGVVEGDSGMGKSSILAVVRSIYGKRIIEVQARRAWNDSPSAFLGQILIDLGEEPGGSHAARRQRKVEQVLAARRTCLAIEEAHHLGPRCIDTLKTLVNVSKTEAVIFAIPTLLKRLETAAYEESKQLFTNRSAFRVRLKVHKADIALMLRNRLPAPGLVGDTEKQTEQALTEAATLLEANCKKHGHYAFVREVCRRVRDTWREEALTRPVTYNDLISAAEAEIAAR